MVNQETKIIGGIRILILVILVSGVFLFAGKQSQETSVPQEQIVSSTGLHWHPRLDIYIKDEKQEIPANIGIAGSIHKELHTHEKDGVIHMEMEGLVTKDETRLGNFFEIWGKDFSKEQSFDKKNGADGKVKMLVNGKESSKFENYEMRDGDKIEIRYEQ